MSSQPGVKRSPERHPQSGGGCVCDSQQAQCRQALESVPVESSDAIVLKVSADGEGERGHGLTSAARVSSCGTRLN